MSRQPYRGGSIPGGHLVGRMANGTGPAELISLADAAYKLSTVNGVGSGAGASAYTGSAGVTLTGHDFTLTVPVTVARGGTNATSASGTALDNITGFSSTGFLKRTGSGTYSFVADPLPVANGGTGLASGTNGGIPAYTGSTTIASSGVLAAGKLMMGGGAAATPATEADWSFASHVLEGNFNAASPPALIGGTNARLTGVDGSPVRMAFDGFAGGGELNFRRANNTNASPTALAAADPIGSLVGRGYGATGYSDNQATVNLVAAEAWSDAAQGTQVLLRTTPVGSTTLTTSLQVEPGGGISLFPITAPGTPVGKFTIYMDVSDNKLKAIGPSGTITPLALP